MGKIRLGLIKFSPVLEVSRCATEDPCFTCLDRNEALHPFSNELTVPHVPPAGHVCHC
jgi:hypothetical protein